MKQKFSTQWIGSKQPRKQRKFRANAPINIRHKMMSANLSKELRKKYGKRNFPLRKGDKVRIMRGGFKKRTGKIENIDNKKFRTTIEGINKSKKDGTKVAIYCESSNLRITELNIDDKRRKNALERKSTPEKRIEVKPKPLPREKKKDREEN